MQRRRRADRPIVGTTTETGSTCSAGLTTLDRGDFDSVKPRAPTAFDDMSPANRGAPAHFQGCEQLRGLRARIRDSACLAIACHRGELCCSLPGAPTARSFLITLEL